MRSFFIFDVESIGLHGDAFAVAGGVYLENGAAQWEFCLSIPTSEARGLPEDREWVSKNVPAIEITHRSGWQMRDAFWGFWTKAKMEGAIMAAECSWPVEARFLADCVHDDPPSRKWTGPYPMHEIASFMDAAGMDPMAKYPREPSELPDHNPLADARQSARLLSLAISKLAH